MSSAPWAQMNMQMGRVPSISLPCSLIQGSSGSWVLLALARPPGMQKETPYQQYSSGIWKGSFERKASVLEWEQDCCESSQVARDHRLSERSARALWHRACSGILNLASKSECTWVTFEENHDGPCYKKKKNISYFSPSCFLFRLLGTVNVPY